jgi:hypothetical protein
MASFKCPQILVLDIHMAGHQWFTEERHQLHNPKAFSCTISIALVCSLEEMLSRVYCNNVLHLHCLLQISNGSCKKQADGDGEGAAPRIDEDAGEE